MVEAILWRVLPHYNFHVSYSKAKNKNHTTQLKAWIQCTVTCRFLHLLRKGSLFRGSSSSDCEAYPNGRKFCRTASTAWERTRETGGSVAWSFSAAKMFPRIGCTSISLCSRLSRLYTEHWDTDGAEATGLHRSRTHKTFHRLRGKFALLSSRFLLEPSSHWLQNKNKTITKCSCWPHLNLARTDRTWPPTCMRACLRGNDAVKINMGEDAKHDMWLPKAAS